MSKRVEPSRNCVALAFIATFFFSTGFVVAQDEDRATLEIGSQAPNLDVKYWLSDNDGLFQHTKTIEPGHVYVIEFWATWCGPCIGVMPLMAELQEKYRDQKVQIISVSDEDLDTVQNFLERKIPGDAAKRTFGELTNSYCLTTDPDKSVKADYFRAARQTGIPCAFVVGKTGLIEWIGHPAELGEPLGKIVQDAWDRNAFLAEKKQKREAQLKAAMAARKLMNSINHIQELANNDQTKEAIELIDELMNDKELASEKEQFAGLRRQILLDSSMREIESLVRANQPEKAVQRLGELMNDRQFAEVKGAVTAMRVQIMIESNLDGADMAFGDFAEANQDDSQILNDFAWRIYQKHEADQNVDMKLLGQAKKAAEVAVRITPESGAILDTLAHLIYVVDGDLDKAIEVQTRAVDLAIPLQRKDIKAFLDQLREEKKTGKQAKKKKVTPDF